MYRVETHDNSREYFSNLVIEKDSLYVTSTTTLSEAIKEKSVILSEDMWRIVDIENLIKTIYSDWNHTLNQIKIKAEVRKIIIDLKNNIINKDELNELRYFEDNIDILINDINLIVQTNIKNFNYTNETITKKIFGLVYKNLIVTEVFNNISKEILDPIGVKSFFKKLKKYRDGEDVKKIYFYNINYLDLSRYMIIELLRISGFEVIFRIPYFNSLNIVNKCWDYVYRDNSIFFMNISRGSNNDIESKYISFLEGKNNITNKNESVITKTYKEVGDFKRELEDKKIITFCKDSLSACMNKEDLSNKHCFQTDIGRFLFNLYSVEIFENDVKIDFRIYRELITSGWMEFKNWNGVKLREYLFKNESYFDSVKTLNEIIDRINKLKDLEVINEIFEDQIKTRIKDNDKKKFLSNPFRAFGYNNTDRYNITLNYMLEVTLKLKRFILKALSSENELIDVKEHFELLKIEFTNKYIIQCNNNGSNIQKLVTRKIWGILNNPDEFGDKLHREELKDLFNILLKINIDDKKEEENKIEDNDLSIDHLEGVILREKMTMDKGKEVIYMADLSIKAYEQYVNNKYNSEKILNYNDFEDIVSSSLIGKHKEIVMKALEFQRRSIKASEAYIKFAFANLFINFQGEKVFSWISQLRKNDGKSIILKQIETIYGNENIIIEHGLDYEDVTNEEDIKAECICYDSDELEKGYEKYCEVEYRNLDFCDIKFFYTSVLNSHPMYYSDFHQKLVFSGIISILKNSIEDSYKNIATYLFPIFPQWEQVVKYNILTCEYGRKNMRDYKYFDGINYPKNIDVMYLLLMSIFFCTIMPIFLCTVLLVGLIRYLRESRSCSIRIS